MDVHMELATLPWQYYLINNFTPPNYVHWAQTPHSHIYSADLPGVRKEEIKVEVEDSTYLIIRTEAPQGESTQPAKSFSRKFRLPANIDTDQISAAYEDGVLTVTVPRNFVRTRTYIHPDDVPQNLQLLARAA